MTLPETLGGWVGLALAVLMILGIVGGLVIRLGRQQIDLRLNDKLGATVRIAVLDGLKPVETRLDGMQLQLTAQNGELARVRKLESKIDNGLIARQKRLEQRMDEIIGFHIEHCRVYIKEHQT
jgi:hypothetical protein